MLEDLVEVINQIQDGSALQFLKIFEGEEISQDLCQVRPSVMKNDLIPLGNLLLVLERNIHCFGKNSEQRQIS